jgi:hypothetical protein
MSLTDWIGTAGVSLLLLAFLLNLLKKLPMNSLTYPLLNLTGAGLACLASVFLRYWPFIILEGVWTLVSAGALWNYFTSVHSGKEIKGHY